MRLKEALKDKNFDVRLLDKWVQEGRVTKKEVDDYYSSLPDDSQRYVELKGEPKRIVAQEPLS